MEGRETFCWFNQISDDVLLHILCFLPSSCWKDVRNVSTRFRNISFDKEFFRHSNLSCAYGVSDVILAQYLAAGNSFIETLNLNHCQWLTSTTLAAGISRCKKIQSLYLLDCRLTTKGLTRVLCSLDCLKTLVISVPNLYEFSNELNSNQNFQYSLRNLQHFGLHIKEETNGVVPNSLQFHLSQQTTIIEYCPNLESFCVIGQPGNQKLSKRLIHPLIVKTQNMTKLKTMSINSTNDATSRLYFFGVLVKAFEAGCHFHNLSVSGLDLKQAVKKLYFIKGLKESCTTLENLDLSKVHIDQLEASVTIENAANLKYLNLSDIRSESSCISVMKIASNCPNLVSLNLKGATSGHRCWRQKELDQFDQLLVNCPHIRHLNLSAIHVHDDEADKTLADILAKRKIKGLESLALPVCNLVNSRQEERRHSTNYSIYFGKRRRIARDHPVASTSSAITGSDWFSDGEVSRLYTACPDITSFELINTGFHQSVVMQPTNQIYVPCVVTYHFTENLLLPVSNWTKLKYLQITGLPVIKTGKSLLEIAKNCVHIERLHLAYMGVAVHNNEIWDTIQHFKNLVDLRIEQPGLMLKERFFQSCLGCQKLQRLLVASKNSKLEPKDLEAYVCRATNLYMLQLYTDSTIKECERLQSILQKRYEHQRPGFLSIIQQLHHEKVPYVLATLPLQHLEEMTILSSKVCSKPLHSIWG